MAGSDCARADEADLLREAQPMRIVSASSTAMELGFMNEKIRGRPVDGKHEESNPVRRRGERARSLLLVWLCQRCHHLLSDRERIGITGSPQAGYCAAAVGVGAVLAELPFALE